MSQPIPVAVVLIGSTTAQVTKAKKHFRLSTPGLGPAYLAALDAQPGDRIIPPAQIPLDRIDLWLALDNASYELCKERHAEDVARRPVNWWSIHEDAFPEACVLLPSDGPAQQEALARWKERITEAYFESS